MIRRARLSFKPNVRPGGRSVGGAARDGASASQPEEPVQPGDSTATAGLQEKSIGDERPLCAPDGGEAERTPDIPEKAAAACRDNEPSKPTTALIQRRKRISTLPNLAKPRVSSSAPVTPSQNPKQMDTSPPLPVSSIPSKDEVFSPEKAKIPGSLKSQGEKGQHVTLPEKRTPVPQVPQFSPQKKVSLKQLDVSPVKSVDLTQREDFSPLKERPSQKSSINESKNFVPKKLVASGNLEKERIRRAQKLRELLKDELRKERKEWKAKHPVIINTGELERSKMVMRDFIYFIPPNNPMTSNFAEPKSAEKAPTDSQLTGTPVKSINNEEDNDLDEEEDEDQLLAPRVKVAEDGSIILDEESLTVEVSRMKAPIVEGNDPIFERGSTTTYSSFRKSSYSKPWSSEETDMFYLAINMVGTDFSMIGQLFPHRERIEIKNKFKREEKANSWRIDKAFKERKAFDMELFSKRLERALDAAKKRRMTPKIRQPREKKPTKPRKKQKDKAAPEQILSDGEIALLSDDEEAHASTEEKENEGSVTAKECFLQSENVTGKKKRSRKKKNENKETEEENCEPLIEDTTILPKKPRKSKSADQVKDSDAIDNENIEDVQAPADTMQEKKKKKSRRKKSTDKGVEMEDTEDGDDVVVSSPARDKVDKKVTGSALPDDTVISTCIESGEPSFTQSEVLTGAEDSSLMLFTEESECNSEPEALPSFQESLSVVPSSQTLADQTGILSDVPVETSQEDSVFETSQHMTSDTPKCIDLEEDMVVDNHTQTKVEGSESQKDSPIKPAALTRSRFQRPRPNVPVRTLPKKDLVPKTDDVTEERNTITADKQSQKQGDMRVPENLDSAELVPSVTGSPKKDDIPCSIQKTSSSDAPHLQPTDSVPPEFEAVKEDISKEKPLSVRGRLVRPKPNLKKAPLKDKPATPQSGSKSDSQDSGEISTVPCGVVLTSVCSSVNEKESFVKETSDSSAGSQDCRQSTNTVPTSNKEIYEDTEVTKTFEVSPKDSTGDISSKLPTEMIKEGSTSEDSCVHQESHKNLPEIDPVLPSDQKSEATVNLPKEVQKPAAPTRGRLQRPKPNIGRALPKKEVLSASNDSGNVPEVEDIRKPHESSQSATILSPIEVEKEPVLAKAAAEDKPFTEEIPESYVPSMEKTVGLATKDKTESRANKELSDSEVVESAAPTEPALKRSRLQRTKPNLGSILTSTTVSSPQKCDKHEEGKSKEDCIKSSMENNDAGETTVLANTDLKDVTSPGEMTTQSYILPLESILPGVDLVEIEEPSSVTTSSNVKIKNDASTPKDERMVEPLPALPRSRLQRPKPNLGRSISRPIVSAPQKSDNHESSDTVSTEESVNLDKKNVESSPAAGHSVRLGTEETLSGSGVGLSQPGVSSCTEEEGKGPSGKPLRNRLQRPKPNLGRAALRKDSRTSTSDQKETNSDSISKAPANLQSTEDTDSALSNDDAGGNRVESAHTAIKPAQLRRGRLARPVPNLGKAALKRQSALQSKTADETESPSDVEVPSMKRKASECLLDKSPKRGVFFSTSPSSSESALDLSASALRESNQSNDAPEDIKQQHSRFGRQLRKPASIVPPVVIKLSENVSEHPEKEKTSRSVKSVKSKIAKPTTSKGKGKTTLVKIRAMKQDEDDDDAELEYEDEDYDVAPDKLNQAPVFVPFSLRSPKYVPAEIEETLEEVPVFPEDHDNIGHYDGSTEAAMALISMGNSVFQSNLGETLDSDQYNENLQSSNTNCKPEDSTLSGQVAYADEENTTLYPRPVSIDYDGIGLQEENEDINLSTDDEILDLSNSSLHTLEEPSQPENNNNMSCPSTQEDAQQRDCSISDGLLEAGGSGEEETFILTLVEIPISEGYPYSCDGSSGDVLPAPVLIPSNSSQVVTQDQSSANTTVSEPSSLESCLSGQQEAKLNSPCRKRSASVSSQNDEQRPYKKALLCSTEREDTRPNIAENEKSSGILDGIKKETEESHQSSIERTTSSTGEERVPECTDDSTILSTANPESTSYEPPRILSPSSSRTQERPGRKPLGFLSLVCKEKQSKKNKVTSQKHLGKLNRKKAKVKIDEDSPSNEVPSQSSSFVETSTPPETETIPSTSQVSENPDTINVPENVEAIAQESPKSLELASEEEVPRVSEFFFSDIFTEVDE